MRLTIAICLLLSVVAALPTEKFSVDNVDKFPIETFIAGGSDAEPGQFPFQVAVQGRKNVGKYVSMSWCGGVLISDELVVTAAHCLVDSTSADVHVGATDFFKEEAQRYIIRVPGENIFVHEDYQNKYLDNDIGLVKLPRKIQLNEYVQPVNLPRISQRDHTFIEQVGWISGWGMKSDDVNKASTSILQWTRRWILPHQYCVNAYMRWFNPEVHVCVDGSHGISACGGDSGGPLTIVEEDGTRTLVGVTSYGKREGCENGKPTVYTRITTYLDWIAKKGGIALRP